MIASIRNLHAQTLCTLAEGDASTLALPLPDQIFGFHAQQACEKYLKALLTVRNVTYPRTHSLDRLTDLVASCGEILPKARFPLVGLDAYAVQFRYDLGAALTSSERAQILTTVKMTRSFVLRRILELQR